MAEVFWSLMCILKWILLLIYLHFDVELSNCIPVKCLQWWVAHFTINFLTSWFAWQMINGKRNKMTHHSWNCYLCHAMPCQANMMYRVVVVATVNEQSSNQMELCNFLSFIHKVACKKDIINIVYDCDTNFYGISLLILLLLLIFFI